MQNLLNKAKRTILHNLILCRMVHFTKLPVF